MEKKWFLLSILLIVFSGFAYSQIQNKIPLDHSVYDSWKDLRNTQISDNGKWVSYEINPQKGDGWLYLVNVTTGVRDSVARGYRASFSPNSDFLVFQIKPQINI